MKPLLAIDFLLSIDSKIIKYGLERTIQLLDACGNPHKNLKSIQVVGTNGKGSTSAMIANVLMKNNYKVGLYTSPHLVTINERIRINNILISNYDMDQFINQYKKDLERIKPSFFEIMTVMALKYFIVQNVDIAILETGLGGRYDSVTAALSDTIIYTPIDIDHTSLLGDNLESIAREKAGAMSSNTSLIFSTTQDPVVKNVLDSYATQLNQKIIYDDNVLLNISLANMALLSLKKSNQWKLLDIQQHLMDTVWPGRIQTLQTKPNVIFDVAHNNHGLQAFIDSFLLIRSQYDVKYLIVAFEAGKNIITSMKELYQLFDFIIITETKIRHSMPIQEIVDIYQPKYNSSVIIEPDVNQAIRSTLKQARNTDIVVILGSHYFGPFIAQIFKNSFDIE
jgi:dihydrofolate synthase/folylpolyglutamate synthase